jgi:Skp family chaperone for outer membrane proteins
MLTIDLNRIISESKVGKDLEKQINSINDNLQKRVQEKQKSISKKSNELESEYQSSSESKRVSVKKKADDLQKEFEMLQNKFRDEATENEEKKMLALQKINDEVRKISSSIAKQKKASSVLPSNVLIYNEDSMDITNEVLKELDESLVSIDLSTLKK